MVGLFLIIYFIFHIPAFLLLIAGLRIYKSEPRRAKQLLIVAGIYFLIGGGIGGSL